MTWTDIMKYVRETCTRCGRTWAEHSVPEFWRCQQRGTATKPR